MIECVWLPGLETCNDLANYCDYEDHLYYDIYKKDFIDSHPTFQDAIVDIRKKPYDNNKEDGFYHVTCKNYNDQNDREPDLRRAERIRWIRPIIENYKKCNDCNDCSGVLHWEEPYKNTTRIYFLLKDERFLVILEPRNTYYVIITAFYIDYDRKLRELLSHYDASKN